MAYHFILLHIRSTLLQAVKQQRNNQKESLKQKLKRKENGQNEKTRNKRNNNNSHDRKTRDRKLNAHALDEMELPDLSILGEDIEPNEVPLRPESLLLENSILYPKETPHNESSILTYDETQLYHNESSILTCDETQSLQVLKFVSGGDKPEQTEDSNLLEKASNASDKESDSCSVIEDKNYINTLKEIIEKKLQNVPDLVCVIFLLSVYPLSVIRSATQLRNPYNVVVSVAAIFPMSLFLTEIKYALYLLMEMPVSIQKPSSLNKGLVKKIHVLYEKIGLNKGKALLVNSSYQVFVYALSQCLSCYWFFFRSLTYEGLAHADHIKTMSESFEDNFDHNFAFNISCRQYLR